MTDEHKSSGISRKTLGIWFLVCAGAGPLLGPVLYPSLSELRGAGRYIYYIGTTSIFIAFSAICFWLHYRKKGKDSN